MKTLCRGDHPPAFAVPSGSAIHRGILTYSEENENERCLRQLTTEKAD